MVRMRLRRVGSKRQSSYRVVVANVKSPRDGGFIDKIGFYNPRTQPATLEINEARALYWLDKGAQPSDAVRRMLDKLGTLERYERFRKGEAMEALIAEAAANMPAPVDARTRRDDIPQPTSKKKAQARAQAEAVAVEAPVEAVAVEEAASEEPVAEETSPVVDETSEAPAAEESEPAAEE